MSQTVLQRAKIATTLSLQTAFARLPLRAQLAACGWLGQQILRRQTARLEIAKANIAFCFPDLTATDCAALASAHGHALGEGIAEAGIAWRSSRDRLLALGEVQGLSAVREAQSQGRGVLLLTGHFTNLEMGVQSIAARIGAHGVWRPLERPVADAVTYRGRMNHLEELIEKTDFRAAMRHLRRGGILTMAFDQADSTASAVEAPFMGRLATCIDTPARLARTIGCAVFLFHTRRKNNRYLTVISEEQRGLGDLEPVAAATQLNRVLGDQVLEEPARYYWVHRRFKHTHPEIYG